MKKNSITFLFFLTTLSLCAQTGVYVIKGTCANEIYNGQKIYLERFNEDYSDLVKIDSALVQKQTFTFKGENAGELALGFVKTNDEDQTYPLVLESGTITFRLDTVSTIGGTPKNEELQTIIARQLRFSNKFKDVENEYTKAQESNAITPQKMEDFKQKYQEVSTGITQANYDAAKVNMDNQIGEFVLLSSLKIFNKEQVTELLNLCRPQFKELEMIKNLETELNEAKQIEIGSTYTDMSLMTPDKKTINLSDYVGKGKVILVDFWASWCGPCRAEMPTLVANYAKYKDKGFDIVGVSLDEDIESWKKAITSLGITWPQMSDLGGWTGKAAALYSVRTIPFTLLIDKEGKIIAKNLRGQQLSEKLNELLIK